MPCDCSLSWRVARKQCVIAEALGFSSPSAFCLWKRRNRPAGAGDVEAVAALRAQVTIAARLDARTIP